MQRPALHLRVGVQTGAPLTRDKPIAGRKDAQVGTYGNLRSTRRRQGAGWEGVVQLTASDWEAGQAFTTPLGKIFGIGKEKGGFSEVFQILLVPQGNSKPLGPSYELSPNRTQNVMAPFAAILHGRFDQVGRVAGVLNMYPYGGRDDWKYIASPDVTDYWNYGWTSAAEIAQMDDGAEFFDDELRTHLGLALTHWLKWDELPEKILNGVQVFDDITPKNVRENEIVMPS